MSEDNGLPRNTKIQAARSLLKMVPPAEFNNIFSKVRILLGDDGMLCQEANNLCAMHNIDNFTPVLHEGHKVLITHHNDLGGGRFLDPQNRVSFKLNHLTKETSDSQPMPEEEEEDELWRSSFQNALNDYVKSHYPTGVCNVFCNTLDGKKNIVACIEAHEHRPSSLWNGLWRSEWTFSVTPPVTQVSGNIAVEAHYYEDGNIHLSANQPIKECLHLNNNGEAAKEFVELVEKADNKLQAGLMEEYKSFPDISLKAIRRQLPVTRSILDWSKLLTSRILETKYADV
ncbi:hypothetical protein FKM82_004902 [Ascaphus truei]